MPLMTGNRKDTVRSTTGHTIGFEEGEESFVPDVMVNACLERGHRLAAGPAAQAVTPATEEASEQPAPVVRRGRRRKPAPAPATE